LRLHPVKILNLAQQVHAVSEFRPCCQRIPKRLNLTVVHVGERDDQLQLGDTHPNYFADWQVLLLEAQNLACGLQPILLRRYIGCFVKIVLRSRQNSAIRAGQEKANQAESL